MKKLSIALIALAVILGGAFGAWWHFSPLWALAGLRDAAEQGDAAELSERVDFTALRSSLKVEMIDMVEQQFGASEFVRRNATPAIGRAIDTAITPENIAAAVQDAPSDPLLQSLLASLGGVLMSAEDGGEAEWEIVRGFDSFRVSRESTLGIDPPVLVFERDGLGWDLAGIDIADLPSGGAAADTAAQ